MTRRDSIDDAESSQTVMAPRENRPVNGQELFFEK